MRMHPTNRTLRTTRPVTGRVTRASCSVLEHCIRDFLFLSDFFGCFTKRAVCVASGYDERVAIITEVTNSKIKHAPCHAILCHWWQIRACDMFMPCLNLNLEGSPTGHRADSCIQVKVPAGFACPFDPRFNFLELWRRLTPPFVSLFFV